VARTTFFAGFFFADFDFAVAFFATRFFAIVGGLLSAKFYDERGFDGNALATAGASD
jgi:hypothetical protein